MGSKVTRVNNHVVRLGIGLNGKEVDGKNLSVGTVRETLDKNHHSLMSGNAQLYLKNILSLTKFTTML